MVSHTTVIQDGYYLRIKYFNHINYKENTMSGRQGKNHSWVFHQLELSKITRELQSRKNVEVDPSEEVFEDDPRALKEQEPMYRRSTNR